MLNKEQLALTMEIVNRSEKLGLMQGDKLTALIDLEKATERFNLRLADMLNADDFHFSHAFVPIQNDINRATGEFSGRFLPRFTGVK